MSVEFSQPPQISVDPYSRSFEDIKDFSHITPHTELFRADTEMHQAFTAASESANPDDWFRIVSAGCSFGAEIDTAFALMHRNMPDQKVGIMGLDNNTEAFLSAQDGVYVVPTSLMGQRQRYANEGYDFDQAMQDHGIEVTTGGPYTYPILNAQPLRQSENMRLKLVQHDLRDALPTSKAANLVLCHNVLFHQKEDDAKRIVTNLTGKLAVGGVLSLGANPAQTGMEGNRGRNYDEWIAETTDYLAGHDLSRVPTDNPKFVAFQRQA